MLKFENLANIGDRIRAYDFRGRKDAFIEGVVTAKGPIKHPQGYNLFDGYTIQIDVDGAGFDREGEDGYIPFGALIDYDDRVEIVEAA